MAIPEELKTAVFAYCREVEDEETLPAMTVQQLLLRWGKVHYSWLV